MSVNKKFKITGGITFYTFQVYGCELRVPEELLYSRYTYHYVAIDGNGYVVLYIKKPKWNNKFDAWEVRDTSKLRGPGPGYILIGECTFTGDPSTSCQRVTLLKKKGGRCLIS